jgi:hypothetical protein
MIDVIDTNFTKTRSPAWLSRIAICFVLAASIAGFCHSANATDWERLPDGRAIIGIKGIKFAFRASGSDLDSIHFNLASPQHATLREVLASPDSYREMFEKNANTNITAYVRDRGGLYLDHFDRNALNSVGFSFDVGDNQKNCNSWSKAFGRARAEDPKDQKLEYGWRESVSAGIEKIYTRDAPAKIQSLYCNELGYCGSSICLLPNVSFIFRFSTAAHPKARWADLLNNVGDMLSYVLPEYSTGKAGNQ